MSIKDTLIQSSIPLPPSPEALPENQKPEITYPGWFAINFGTSNSTVTLYDPKFNSR
jgi:hypothetical protein